MILKGSQRANGSDLAVHLMNGFDNETIEIAQLYGTAAEDLLGAFAEFEIQGQGTKARDYLYSVSINPSRPLSREQYAEAIKAIEAGLGLTGQPHAVVFHIKEGREHCHVVWSRVDVESMKAIPMSFDHSKLMNLACRLANQYGLELPPGLKAWQDKATKERQAIKQEKREVSLAENAQTRRTGITREERRALFTALYEQADSGQAFRAALEEQGYQLAVGTRRAYVAVDLDGDVHSISRFITSHKARQIKAKLASIDADTIPLVDDVIDQQRSKTVKITGQAQEQNRPAVEQLRNSMEADLQSKQSARRHELSGKEQALLTRQAEERLQLHAAQLQEQRGLLYRAQTAIMDLIQRVPALHSVLNPIQQRLGLDPKAKQALQQQALAQRHQREQQDISRQKRLLTQVEKRERLSLETWLTRQSRLLASKAGELVQEFEAVAENKARYQQAGEKTDSGELAHEFNQQAAGPKQQKGAGGRKSARSSWESRGRKSDKKKQRGRGRGYGYKRNKNHDNDPDHGS